MFRCSSLKGDPQRKETKNIRYKNNFLRFFKHNEPSLWSELPVDLLGEIMERLNVYDQVHCIAVCKNWLFANYEKRLAQSLPQLLIWCSRRQEFMFSECQLYGPSKANAVDTVSLGNLFPIISNKFATCFRERYSKPVTFKNDWILYARQKLDARVRKFFLFSPFTKKIIKLPDFDNVMLRGIEPAIVAFSAQPTSPGCHLFLLHKYDDLELTISTYCHGDNKWISSEFDHKLLGELVRDCVVYIRGNFYLLSELGNLGEYNLDQREWHVLAYSKFPPGWRFHWWNYRMLESDGELLLVCFSRQKKITHNNGIILKFDWYQKVWVLLKSLMDRALFLGYNCFSIELPADAWTANKVYYLNGLSSEVYFYTDGTLYYCGEDSVSNGFTSRELPIWIQPQDQLMKLPRLEV